MRGQAEREGARPDSKGNEGVRKDFLQALSLGSSDIAASEIWAEKVFGHAAIRKDQGGTKVLLLPEPGRGNGC